MRLNERVLLQYIDDDVYLLIDDITGVEFTLSVAETARLWVGLTYFVQSDHTLRDQVVETLRQLTGQAREDARTVLIGSLGTLGLQDSTTPVGVPQ
jgi:pantothenate kinase